MAGDFAGRTRVGRNGKRHDGRDRLGELGQAVPDMELWPAQTFCVREPSFGSYLLFDTQSTQYLILFYLQLIIIDDVQWLEKSEQEL